MTPEEFHAQVAAGVIKHHGLPESIAMVADGLGFALDDISETIEPVIAEEIIKTEFLEVTPGQVAGVHQIARGVSAGKEKIFMELKMYVGARHPADTVVLKGEPHLTLTIPGGTHGDVATAAVVVNSIPAILAANAGLRTSRDLPLAFSRPMPNHRLNLQPCSKSAPLPNSPDHPSTHLSLRCTWRTPQLQPAN